MRARHAHDWETQSAALPRKLKSDKVTNSQEFSLMKREWNSFAVPYGMQKILCRFAYSLFCFRNSLGVRGGQYGYVAGCGEVFGARKLDIVCR